MAEKVVLNVEIKDNVDQTTKSFDKLGKSVDKAEKSVINLDATFEEVYGDLKPLTTRMGEAEDRLYELGLAGKQATDEYKALLASVGNYRKVQIQTDLVVDSAAKTFGQKLASSVQGATSAFAGVQGAMGLVGVESQGLEKALLRVQSAMALSEGFKGVRESIPAFTSLASTIKNNVVSAFSSLKGAIIGTGIGALVIGIGLLIANFDKLKNALSSGLSSAKEFETSTHDNAEAARKAVTDFDNYEKTLRRLGNTEEEIADKRKKRFKEAIDQTENELKASKKVYEEQLKNLKTVGTFDKLGLSATGRLLFGDEDEAKAQREKIKEVRASLEKLKNDEFEFNAKIVADKKASLEKDKQNEINTNKEKLEKYKEYLRKKKEADDLWWKQYFENQENQKINDKNEADKLAEIDNREAERRKQKEQDEAESIEFISKLKIEGWEKQAAEEEAAEKKKKERHKANEDAMFTASRSTFQAIGQVATAFAGKSEKEQKRAFEINKAVNIATAVMDTYKGATAALASGSEINPVFGFVSAAAVVAAGLANVATISKQQFNGGGAANNNSTSNAPNTNNNVQAPNFSVIGNNGINQLGQIQQQPVQAFVVSGQVSTQQALDRNRVRNATFG